MKPLFISGIGVICAKGRGLDKFQAALKEDLKIPAVSAEERAAYRVPADDLTDREVLRQAKRADRFSRLTVLAAYDAVRDSGLSLPGIQRQSTGIVLATAFGAHSTIFKFLDDIIDYGECNVSPTKFAHSIHNAAASYIAATLECKGPAMTVTQFHFSFHQALLLAYAWLCEGRVERVLVGVADECSPAMEYIYEEKLSGAGGKMRKAASGEKPGFIPGEGSAFFLLTLDRGAAKYGAISGIEMERGFQGWPDAGLSIVSGNAMAGAGANITVYPDVYGGLMSSGGFECAAAALMLKNQVMYGKTDAAGAGGVATQQLRVIQSVSHNCEGELAFVKIEA